MESIKLIATYARVSTSNQEQQKTILTQRQILAEYADKNGCSIVKEYLDDGWSGDSLIRPALDELRIDAKKGIWKILLIYDPDRLARRYSYQELLLDELREDGVEVIFITTPTPKDGIERILYGVQGIFAEYEREKIKERFRLGRIRKAKSGYIITSRGPYGYDYIPKKGNYADGSFQHGFYKVNNHEAEVVRMIFNWVGNEGLSSVGIVNKLHELGIQPRVAKRKVWAIGMISKMIKNKTYIGEAHYCATYAVVPAKKRDPTAIARIKKSSQRRRPESEWIKIKVPSIIDEELFEKAQNQMKLNRVDATRNRKREYLLSGRIWCICGMRRVGQGARHNYYRCTDKLYSFPLKPNCKEGAPNSNLTDILTWQTIIKFMTSSELLIEQISRWKLKNKSIPKSKFDVKEREMQLQKLNQKHDRFAKAYAADLITIEQLREYTESIKKESSVIKKQISIAEDEMANEKEILLPSLDEIKDLALKHEKSLAGLTFATKRAIVEQVVEKATASKRALHLKMYIPLFAKVTLQNQHMKHSDVMRTLIADNNRGYLPIEVDIAFPKRMPCGFLDAPRNKLN